MDPLKKRKVTQAIITGKLTGKSQTTIPRQIREVSGLSPADSVVFEVDENKKVFIRWTAPMDLEFIKGLDKTLSEWSSSHDEEAYGDL